jgi:flagellin-like hook-associated protein FlgL
MKILVALKQVPARDSVLKPSSDGRWIDEDGLQFEINEPDAYALEAGLQLKEKLGGEVVVLSAGPARVGSSIREALAKGADRAITEMAAGATALGAAKARIEIQESFVAALMDAIEGGISQLVDADMNEESTKLQALQVKQQLGIQALSIANSSSQSILSLLR